MKALSLIPNCCTEVLVSSLEKVFLSLTDTKLFFLSALFMSHGRGKRVHWKETWIEPWQ